MIQRLLTVCFALAICSSPFPLFLPNAMAQNGEPFFIGGYGESIYASRLHSDGSMDVPIAVGSLARPNFFARHPQQEILYAVGSAVPPEQGAPGVVAAFRWDIAKLHDLQSDAFRLVNQQPIPLDTACHISIDPRGVRGGCQLRER